MSPVITITQCRHGEPLCGDEEMGAQVVVLPQVRHVPASGRESTAHICHTSCHLGLLDPIVSWGTLCY